MTGRTTRADRLAHPTTRDAVRAVAENHGACLHPVQLRRINTETGETEQVLIPCGATLASKCPPCAERAKTLRAAQCAEGWHLETEPIADSPPPDEVQAMWSNTAPRPKPGATRPRQRGKTRASWMS